MMVLSRGSTAQQGYLAGAGFGVMYLLAPVAALFGAIAHAFSGEPPWRGAMLAGSYAACAGLMLIVVSSFARRKFMYYLSAILVHAIMPVSALMWLYYNGYAWLWSAGWLWELSIVVAIARRYIRQRTMSIGDAGVAAAVQLLTGGQRLQAALKLWNLIQLGFIGGGALFLGGAYMDAPKGVLWIGVAIVATSMLAGSVLTRRVPELRRYWTLSA